MEDLIVINAVIGDRTYRMKLDKTDEETVRKSLKIINDKLIEFKSQFAGKDMQDYVAMVLIWFATEQNKVGNFLIQQQSTEQKLSSIEHLLDKMLDA
jgi:cell division protein ZapA